MAPSADFETAKRCYQEKGYCLLKNFLPEAELIAAREWLKAQPQEPLAKSWTDQEPGVKLAVLQGIQYQDNPLGSIANSKELTDVAEKLLGEPVYVWSSKINVKAAFCGTAEYYHQDFVYWSGRGYQQDRMLTAMVIMEPHTLRNGGLHVFPGSHMHGPIMHEPFINVNGLSKNMVPPRILAELYDECGLQVIEGDVGDVLFFHTCLVHGSAHNISNQSRMILLAQMNAHSNKPVEVKKNAKQFNLQRCERELREAERRLDFFKQKYEKQLQADNLTFNAPIPDQEY